MTRYNDDSTMSETRSQNSRNVIYRTQTERSSSDIFHKREQNPNMFTKNRYTIANKSIGPLPRVDPHMNTKASWYQNDEDDIKAAPLGIGAVPRVDANMSFDNSKLSIFKKLGRNINSINARPIDLFNQTLRDPSSDLTLNSMQRSNFGQQLTENSPRSDTEKYPYKMGNNGWYHYEQRGDIPKKAADYEKKLEEFEKTRSLRKMQKSWIPSV